MSSPFDDEDGRFSVLVNAEGQYSLWPHTIAVPAGWSVAYGPAARADCLDFVERTWTDLRPASLIRQLESDAEAWRSASGPAVVPPST